MSMKPIGVEGLCYRSLSATPLRRSAGLSTPHFLCLSILPFLFNLPGASLFLFQTIYSFQLTLLLDLDIVNFFSTPYL